VVYACHHNAVTGVEGVGTVVQDELDRAGDDHVEVDGVGVMHGDLRARILTPQCPAALTGRDAEIDKVASPIRA